MDLQVTRKLSKTRNIPKPTYYIEAIDGEFSEWALNEERAVKHKGTWREDHFSAEKYSPLDLEIGTGNGYFFSHYASQNPSRNYIGLEIKFKPLIQSIRRALREGARNAKIARYHANDISHLFAENEIDRVFIHHPDPWPRRREHKKRLINTQFLNDLYKIQRPGNFVEFKTDHLDYFKWALKFFEESQYEIEGKTFDLHNSEWADQNFETHFEKIFLQKGQPIYYARLIK